MGNNVMANTDRWVIGGVVALILIVFLVSPRDDGDAKASRPVAEANPQLAAQVAEVDTRLTSQASLVEELKGRVGALETANRANDNRYAYAAFQPTSDGFQRVDTSFGSFAISIEDVVPYGDGTKMTIKVGNPSAASYDGAKLLIEYGRAYDAAKTKDVADLSKQKEHTLLTPIKAGSWNPNSVILPGIKPDEMLWINVRLTVNQIYLSER